MEDPLLRTTMKMIFTPGAEYQLPAGFHPLCEDPRKAEVLALMSDCDALGLVGRTDTSPQPAGVGTRKAKAKAKAPTSSDKDGQIPESGDESEEEPKEEASGSN